jgi:hypothetical protein
MGHYSDGLGLDYRLDYFFAELPAILQNLPGQLLGRIVAFLYQ